MLPIIMFPANRDEGAARRCNMICRGEKEQIISSVNNETRITRGSTIVRPWQASPPSLLHISFAEIETGGGIFILEYCLFPQLMTRSLDHFPPDDSTIHMSAVGDLKV